MEDNRICQHNGSIWYSDGVQAKLDEDQTQLKVTQGGDRVTDFMFGIQVALIQCCDGQPQSQTPCVCLNPFLEG